jgi:hypothetical protein
MTDRTTSISSFSFLLTLVGKLVGNKFQEPDKTDEQRQRKRLKKQHGQSLISTPKPKVGRSTRLGRIEEPLQRGSFSLPYSIPLDCGTSSICSLTTARTR